MSVTTPAGFTASGVAAGIKPSGKKDAIEIVVERIRQCLRVDCFRLGSDRRIPLGVAVEIPNIVNVDAHAFEAATKQDPRAAVD